MVFEAGYPASYGSDFRKVVKMTVLIKKLPALSDEAFVRHYNTHHAQAAASMVKKHGGLYYSLTYCLGSDRKQYSDIMRGHAHFAAWDCVCTFVFPSWLNVAKFMYDPRGKELRGDHENFMVESEMRVMVGDEYVLLEGGEFVNASA